MEFDLKEEDEKRYKLRNRGLDDSSCLERHETNESSTGLGCGGSCNSAFEFKEDASLNRDSSPDQLTSKKQVSNKHRRKLTRCKGLGKRPSDFYNYSNGINYYGSGMDNCVENRSP